MRKPSSLHRSVSRSVTGALFAAVFAAGIAPALAQTSVEFMQQSGNDSIVVGQRAQFTYVIINTGAEAAIFPQLYGELPGNGTVEWMTSSPSCSVYGGPENQTLECDFDYLDIGDYQYAEVHGVPTECTVLESLVSVSGANFATQTEQDLIVVGCAAAGGMTGGGNLVAGGVLLTQDFALRCDVADARQNLDLSWSGGKQKGKKDQMAFRLSALTTADCINDPMIVQPSPKAGFNTFVGRGVGTCNGEDAEISFVFTQGGKAGGKDTAEYHISGGCTLAMAETDVTSGKQKASKD